MATAATPAPSLFPQLSFGPSATKPVLRHRLQVPQGVEPEAVVSAERRQAALVFQPGRGTVLSELARSRSRLRSSEEPVGTGSAPRVVLGAEHAGRKPGAGVCTGCTVAVGVQLLHG